IPLLLFYGKTSFQKNLDYSFPFLCSVAPHDDVINVFQVFQSFTLFQYSLDQFMADDIETNDDEIECLWVRVKGKANKADIVLGVCYPPLDQEEEVNNLFYKQLENLSGSSALVLVGDFNLPDICWELITAEKKQSRKFLECVEDNFLLQLVSESCKGGTMLDLLFANRDGLVGDVVVGGHLGHSDHEIIEFSIFGEMRRNINKTFTLDFRRADFGLFRQLIQRVPWEAALKKKGAQEREAFDAIDIETNDDEIECLWVRVKGKANKADIVLGVCYPPLDQEEEVNNLFYKQLENLSGSSALVLVGDFNLPDICWELITAEKKQSRKFLECVEDNFLLQLVSESCKGGTMLDLLFANRDGLVGDVVVGGHLGHSDHEIIEFSIFGEMRRNINKTFTLDFRRADFGLFRQLIQRVPWEAALKKKGAQERWAYFKTEILRAQEQTVPGCQKTS
ncbi:hypothetical protein HGM15179_020502, partial [Zosterops borbonicus]